MNSTPTGILARDVFLALAVFVLFAAGLLWPVLSGRRVLFPCDMRTAAPWQYNADGDLRTALAREPANELLSDKNVFDFPKLHLARGLWCEEGKVPLWNPYTFSGNPLLATAMPSLLYPGNMLFLIDAYRGFTWAAFAHFVLSGLFMFLYARTIGLRSLAALMAGAAYAFSGWHLAHLNLPSFLYAATWLPLMVLAVERFAGGAGFRWLGVLAAGTALCALAGFPPVAVLSLYLTAAYVLFRFPAVARRLGFRRALRFPSSCALAVILGLGIAAPQLIPTHVLSRHSGRAHLERSELEREALRPLALLGLALPDFFGNPADAGPGGIHRPGPLLPRALGLDGPPDGQSNNYLENALYPGLVPLALALFALVASRRRSVTWFWGAAGLVALALSLAVPPFSRALTVVPGLDLGPVKRHLFVWAAALAILAGVGLDAWLGASRPRSSRNRLVWVLVTAGWLVPGALLLVPGLLESALARLATLSPQPGAETSPAAMALWVENTRGCLLRFSVVAAPACLVFLLPGRGRWRPVLAVVAVALAFVDLAWFGRRFNPVHRPDQMEPTPAIAFLARPGEPPFRVARFGEIARIHRVLPPDTGMVHGIQDVHGWDVLFPARYQRFMNLIEPGVARAHHLVKPFLDPASLESPLLDLLGVRYVLTHRDWGPEPVPGFRRAYPLDSHGGFHAGRIEAEGVVIYENTRALARAFTALEVHRAVDEDDAFRALASPDFDPARTVVLEGMLGDSSEPGPDPANVPGHVPAPLEPASVTVRGYRSRHVELEVGPGGPAVLVLADAFSPQWRATMDGTPLEILRANGVLRAVDLPRRDTKATVRFHYPGRAFSTGAVVCTIALALLALAAAGRLVVLRRHARSRRSSSR